MNERLIELMKKTNTSSEKELQEKLKKEYYSNVPLITDEEYDELFGDKDYVGYTPDNNSQWKVLEHKIQMGSLDKIKTWVDAQRWINNRKVVWQPKLDGLSMELVYQKGKLTHAILRGGGDKGEDILNNAINFQGVLPITNEMMYNVSVRGEVVISQSNFDSLKKDSNEAYSNRRNCIPGICRRYDGKYSKLLSFYTYDIIFYDDNKNILPKYNSYLDKIIELHNLGFKLPFTVKEMSEEMYNRYADIRNTSEEFQMDGLVIKSLEDSSMIALKFAPNGEQTKVTGYSWDVGSTGKLVPVIHFEQIEIGGTKLTKASVGSYKLFKDLDAPIGSIVEVRKMNDVIPKVTKRISKSSNNLESPTICPVCGSNLQLIGADLYCVNNKCQVKILQSCTQVYSTIMMKGITANWVKGLVDNNIIQEPSDVLKVTAEDISKIKGYSINTGEKIVQHIKFKISEIRDNNLIKSFLSMIPIPTIGGKALDKFSEMFTSLEELESWLISWSIDRHSELNRTLGNSKGDKAFEYINLDSNRQNILNLLITLLNM